VDLQPQDGRKGLSSVGVGRQSGRFEDDAGRGEVSNGNDEVYRRNFFGCFVRAQRTLMNGDTAGKFSEVEG
jgi:hypothetical protein